MKKELKKYYCDLPVVIRDNMVCLNSSPHTAPVAHLPQCCCGRETAAYYFMGHYFDTMDKTLAEGILDEIEKLQITDISSEHYGAMRWYREETCVTDTNGAFFVLLSMALTYFLCEAKLSEYEKEHIKSMLENAGVWFGKESKGALFYTNKVMSDGAMLALIAHITQTCEEECESFWTRWNTYADARGWGWGENASDTYSVVILNALNVVMLVMKETPLKAKLMEKRKQLLDYIAFHGGKEYIPSIRSYNFKGDINYGGQLYKCSRGMVQYRDAYSMIASVLMLETDTVIPQPREERRGEVRREPLFDDIYAYTWMGKGMRLGSVSQFPLMPNSCGGLGWQSMPVSAMIEGENISYLRFRTVVKGMDRTHPAGSNFHDAYLSHDLFEEEIKPEYLIRTAQSHNLLIVTRGLAHLHNYVEGIYDEWFMPKGAEDVQEKIMNGRTWYVIRYHENAIALSPLGGIGVNGNCREALPTRIIRKEGQMVVSTALYTGEGKAISQLYLENSWAIVGIEDVEKAEAYLASVTITDELLPEYEIPRNPMTSRRRMTCSDGVHKAMLEVDPYDMCSWHTNTIKAKGS